MSKQRTTNYPIGTRIRVTRIADKSGAVVGQIGTIVEDSIAPWILFDEPTLYKDIPPHLEGIDGAAEWHFDCLCEEDFEPLEEDKPDEP